MQRMQAEEQARLTREKAEREQRRAEAARKAEKPVQGAGRELLNKPAKQMVSLRTAEKAVEVHPMIAAMSGGGRAGTKKKKK